MFYTIREPADAGVIATHFNQFHDACLVRLSLSWANYLDNQKSLHLYERGNCTLSLSHYNYDHAQAPFHENVRIDLADVADFRADFSSFQPSDWAITELTVAPANGVDAVAFDMACTWNYFANGTWMSKMALQLRFREAGIWERDSQLSG